MVPHLGSRRNAARRRTPRPRPPRESLLIPSAEILFVSNSGFDVRRMVPGRCDPWGLYRRFQADRRLAQKIGRAIGQILVEQHIRIVEADAAGWLRQQVPWPETGAWIGERLPSVIDDRGLIRALADVIEEYEGMAVDAADWALVHGDLGLHNLALAQADAVNGVFDYDGAAWADRHHDFRYLLFDVGREDISSPTRFCEQIVRPFSLLRCADAIVGHTFEKIRGADERLCAPEAHPLLYLVAHAGEGEDLQLFEFESDRRIRDRTRLAGTP